MTSGDAILFFVRPQRVDHDPHGLDYGLPVHNVLIVELPHRHLRNSAYERFRGFSIDRQHSRA
jgi:hypothetical protein